MGMLIPFWGLMDIFSNHYSVPGGKDTVELRSALRLLRERWKLILVVTLLATTVSGVLTWRATPQYASQVTLFVSAWGNLNNPAAAYQGGLLSEQKVKSYSELMRSQHVMTGVIGQLGLPLSSRELTAKVSTASVPDTALLTVTVTDPSPAQAQRIANTLAEEFVRLIPKLESTPEAGQSAVRISVVSAAELPSAPVSPQPVRNLAVALVLGALAGLGLAGARRSLDTSIKTAEQLEELSGTPSLGTVTFDSSVPKNPLITGSPHSPRAEAYRKIRTNMQFVDIDRSNRVILVTSALPNEGKSVTACNLAIAFAEAQKRVILIDADLRHPNIASYLGLPNGVGLTNVLVGDTSVDEAIQVWGEQSFSVLASGRVPPNPSELLGSRQMRGILEELRERYDVVLIDAPPVLPVADAAAAAIACDGVLLVLRHGRTRHDQLHTTLSTLRNVEVPIVGTVLNFARSTKDRSYYHYQYPTRSRHLRRPFSQPANAPQTETRMMEPSEP
jgi:capsular exopolysaccharide synthesis family protein